MSASAILADVPIAIISTDLAGRIVTWNREAELLFQVGDENVLGTPLGGLFDTDWEEQIRPLVESASAGQRTEGQVVMAHLADGNAIAVSLALSPVLGEDGQVSGVVLVAQRIAEAARAEDDLKQFASAMSHDLQEPLRTVASFCALLERKYADQFDEKGAEYVQHAASGSQRLEAMINDLLAYTRLATEVKPVAPTESHEAVAEAVEALRAQIDDCGAVVIYEELPQVLINASELEAVFENLMGNAIKYRSSRVPEIRVRAESRDHAWEFCVEDNGIGIDPKYWDRIFGVFKRLHPHHIFEGTGMGLPSCKRIIERRGGRIWIASEPGVGSTFFFTLPR